MSLEVRYNEAFIEPTKYLRNIYGYNCEDEFAVEAWERQTIGREHSFIPVVKGYFDPFTLWVHREFWYKYWYKP